MRYLIGYAIATALFFRVLFRVTASPSESDRYDAVVALNEAGMREGWLALSEGDDKNLPWQQGALTFEGDGPDLHLVVALSDAITHYQPSSPADAYWARFKEIACERINPIVAEHLGADFRVDVYAWDRDLVLPDRPYGMRSARVATLPRDCVTGGRFGTP